MVLAALAQLSVTAASRAAENHVYDIVVYGGTPAGITAAIQGRRMGHTVVLIEPGRYLGGMTTGGLGATDFGNKKAIGGLAKEFYGRIHAHYETPTAWAHEMRDDHLRRAGPFWAPYEGMMWTFEPHVAAEVFTGMLGEAGVPVVIGERLDLQGGVKKAGLLIDEIIMESGAAFRGKMFIDATYEGDLMAKAGVRYHVGREGNNIYGETLNGVQASRDRPPQFSVAVDPYVRPGDPSSGLLPGVQPGGLGEEGSGDHRVQAYNFRMCTTDVPENRRPWPKPEGYDPSRYELLFRNFEAGDGRVPWGIVWLPNRKTDTNSGGAISTDNLGMNYDYPEADYAMRERITREHEEYQKGLMWTLANHPRVPPEVRAEFQRLGLAKDEFIENDNWPTQLYVREARRMASDYVMTEHDCRGKRAPEDSVGLASYPMDSHFVRRYVDAAGHVRNEGEFYIGSATFPISYRSIVPAKDECGNLLVPVCVSASHVAFGSIRMEPVAMVLGQSAATAASHAIREGQVVQQIDYPRLRSRLAADGQLLAP